MQAKETRKFIQEALFNILEQPTINEEICEKYFSKDYVQYVDGKKLNYEDFFNHIKTLKSIMKSIKVSYKYIIVEDDLVATLHIVDGVKKNNETIKAQVNAVMRIKDKKIILCDELTHLIEGQKSDEDLGSRH